jgi:large repetitive protein
MVHYRETTKEPDNEAKTVRLPMALRSLASAGIAAAVFLSSAATTFATGIATDKPAYLPGERVTVTGAGWQPQEMISLFITNSTGAGSSMRQFSAGPDGTFKDGSYTVSDLDSGQLIAVTARGESGAETMLGFRAGVAPGSLRCEKLTPSSRNSYGVSPGVPVTCTIEGASDLAPAQQANLQPVEVLVKSGTLGIQRAMVTSVSGSTIQFTWTPPSNACGTTTVSYGPIPACENTWGKCATLPAEGNEANNLFSGGIGGSAGFAIQDSYGNPIACSVLPQLQVAVSPKNGSFTAESQPSYTIVVTNPSAGGARTATNVQLVDQLPGNGGMVWESASTSQGRCANPIANNTLNCSLGDVPPQGSVTVTVKTSAATPVAACQWQQNAAATATADGSVTASDSGSLNCTPLPPAKLNVVTIPKNDSFAPGAQVSYMMYVTNPAAVGSAPARNVQLKDQLPGNGGIAWTSVSTSAGSCSLADNYLNCSLGDILAQRGVMVVVKSTATTPPEACQDQPNPGIAVSAGGGLTAEDSGFVTCTTGVPPQLTLSTSPKNGTFTAGAPLSFSTVVSNSAPAGAAPAKNVQVTGQLPGEGGLTWNSVNVSQGACTISSNSLNCSLGTLPPGKSATVVVSTPATTPATGCTWQTKATANVIADGGYSASDNGYFACVQQPSCKPSTVAIGNVSWNKFDMPAAPARALVWVHAHLGSVSGISTRGTPVQVTFRRGSLTLNNVTYNLPDGSVTFFPGGRAAKNPALDTTRFNGFGWETVVDPGDSDEEIFFTGVAIPVDQLVAAGAKATVKFDEVYSDVAVAFSWQWSAAAYIWPADRPVTDFYGTAGIQAVHDSYHAGAPTIPVVQKLLIPGPRGGPGSNFTGSWSSTGDGRSQCRFSDVISD